MDGLTKTIQNNILAAFGAKAPDNVLKAIHKASAKTGVNFAYMVQQAAVESSFDPKAKAKTSSASGLYQFISSTWMGMIDKYGDKHGIDTDGMSKKEILALRSLTPIQAWLKVSLSGARMILSMMTPKHALRPKYVTKVLAWEKLFQG